LWYPQLPTTDDHRVGPRTQVRKTHSQQSLFLRHFSFINNNTLTTMNNFTTFTATRATTTTTTPQERRPSINELYALSKIRRLRLDLKEELTCAKMTIQQQYRELDYLRVENQRSEEEMNCDNISNNRVINQKEEELCEAYDQIHDMIGEIDFLKEDCRRATGVAQQYEAQIQQLTRRVQRQQQQQPQAQQPQLPQQQHQQQQQQRRGIEVPSIPVPSSSNAVPQQQWLH
jgi:transcription initiation factor TFIID subunit TAF12